MKINFTKSRLPLLYTFQLLLVILFSFSKAFATMSMTIKGQANGAVFVQGDYFQWNISGLSNGAFVYNQLWIDLNGNGIVDPGTDLLFVSFGETDGVSGGNNGPGDDDGLVNGNIYTYLPGLSFPTGNYIFKSRSGTDSVTSTFSITPMISPACHVSGKVTKNGTGLPYVTVAIEQSPGGYYTLTDSSGNYTIPTNLPAGTNVSVRVPTESFNSFLSGYIISPSGTNLTLTGNDTAVNFAIIAGKIITGFVRDTLGNGISNLQISIYPKNGGNGYNGRTDGNGNYSVSVDTGAYTVQFGSDQEPKGYLKTYYNQKYVSWISDTVFVTSSTDTVKNINAILRMGGLIMGTFINNGSSARGNITAFAYNSPGSQLYEVWHDSTDNFYYLFVPPGVYTIQFNLENSSTHAYYNQTISWPGTPVTVLSLTDTAKNINVDFSSIPVPHKFVFIGNGNWSNPGNWKDNLIAPSPLNSGDSIVINHFPGGQCYMDIPQTNPQIILSGGFMTVKPGCHLIIPGELKLQ